MRLLDLMQTLPSRPNRHEGLLQRIFQYGDIRRHFPAVVVETLVVEYVELSEGLLVTAPNPGPDLVAQQIV